jgi:organic hydroperoxide reductase OsmC/OhrA
LSLKLEVALEPLKKVGLTHAQAKQLVEEAHKLCPYSRAIAGNVEVSILLN